MTMRGHPVACENLKPDSGDLRKYFIKGVLPSKFSVVEGHTGYYLMKMTRAITAALGIRIIVVPEACSRCQCQCGSPEISSDECLTI